MAVIDLWNAGEQRPLEILIQRRVIPGQPCRRPWHFSERRSRRSRLESLVLDEGSGTLDSETLDAALNTLESLRLSGRTIGVISHIDQGTYL